MFTLITTNLQLPHLNILVLLPGETSGADGCDGNEAVQLIAVLHEERDGVMSTHGGAQEHSCPDAQRLHEPRQEVHSILIGLQSLRVRRLSVTSKKHN